MYCEPCRVERLGTARFCVVCGSKLHARDPEEIEADLAHVRWLLTQLPEWDQATVAQRARQYVFDRYRAREKVLVSALTESPPGTPAPSRRPATTPGGQRARTDAAARDPHVAVQHSTIPAGARPGQNASP